MEERAHVWVSKTLCLLFEYIYCLKGSWLLKLIMTDDDRNICLKLLPADSRLNMWRLPQNDAWESMSSPQGSAEAQHYHIDIQNRSELTCTNEDMITVWCIVWGWATVPRDCCHEYKMLDIWSGHQREAIAARKVRSPQFYVTISINRGSWISGFPIIRRMIPPIKIHALCQSRLGRLIGPPLKPT